MQMSEASFVLFLRWALGGSCLAGGNWGSGDIAHKDFSGPFCLLPKGDHVWSRFPAPASTRTAPVPREQESAQTLLGHRTSNGLGEKPESATFLSNRALGLSLVSRGEFHFHERSYQKLVLCLF